MPDYDILHMGASGTWRTGHTTPDGRPGKGFVDKLITTQYLGLSVNAYAPGTGEGFWHSHSQLEELYLVIEGKGEMALDDEIVDLEPGTTIRVGQGIKRAVRATPDSPTELRYVCARAGGGDFDTVRQDVTRFHDPLPWA